MFGCSHCDNVLRGVIKVQRSEISEALHLLEPVTKAIAQAFGSNCEVLIHDLSDPARSIACIENGHVTGRKVGDPITDLGLETISQGAATTPMIYRSRTGTGRELRSCSVVLRDKGGQVIGALCINLDITDMLMAQQTLDALCSGPVQLQESYVTGPSELLGVLIAEAVRAAGKPISLMQREDKLRVVEFLAEKDAFRIKRAVEETANALGVSRVTVYNYLEEIRSTGRQRTVVAK